MRLHIGAGLDYRDGWVNIDIDESVKADYHCDMADMPFDNDTFDEVYSHHALEHGRDLVQIVAEMVRVSKNGAEWTITVPYWTWSQNQGNPHHHIYFSEHTFNFFGKTYKRGHNKDWTLEVLDISYGLADDYDDASGPICLKKYLNVAKDITFKIKVHK